MILALFTIIILTSLVSVLLMVTIGQHAKTRKATDFTFAGQAANAAVNDALFMANNNDVDATLEPDPGEVGTWDFATPREGVTGDFRWSWYSYPAAEDMTWVIVATGCRNVATDPPCAPNSSKSSRTMTATLTGIKGPQVAAATSNHSFGRALFADQDLVLQGSAKVTSYRSVNAEVSTGYGQVGTNGLATFDSGVDVDGIFFSNTAAVSSSDRCSGLLCNPGKIHDLGTRVEVSDTSFIDAKIAELCPPDEPPLAWVASEVDPQPAVLTIPTAGYLCYSSMTFDADTTIVGTRDEPTVVYVSGHVAVGAGVSVGIESATPAASKLQIFSSGPVVSITPGGSMAESTDVAWALWAPKALCSTNGAGYATVYGSMVCRKIFVQGTFAAKWDESLRTLATEQVGPAIWEISGYRTGVDVEVEAEVVPEVP